MEGENNMKISKKQWKWQILIIYVLNLYGNKSRLYMDLFSYVKKEK